MAITFKQTGDYKKITNYFERVKEVFKLGALYKYGREGVAALASATPKDTGLTADSWYYEIENQNGVAKVSFHNKNLNKNVNIALILQLGHGTRNGGWVEGRDYINPAIQPVFDDLANDAWKEVTKV